MTLACCGRANPYSGSKGDGAALLAIQIQARVEYYYYGMLLVVRCVVNRSAAAGCWMAAGSWK